MAIWRRRRVDAYLALPPLRRARRTWTSWGRVRRAAAVLALAPLWTVLCLPLRMLGLVGLGASQAGVAAVAIAAPIAAFVPLRSRGRFADPLPEPGPPWRGSRAARAAGRALLAAGLAAAAVVGVLAALGPGPAGPPAARSTPAARHADVVMVQGLVAQACGPDVGVRVTPVGLHRYTAAIEGGGVSTVDIERGTGFDATGARARVEGGAVACPAG